MLQIKPINNTTYEAELVSGNKVEIGDREAVDFKPQLKLNRWDGECFIKVGLPTRKKIAPIVEGDKVKWVEPNLEAHFYPLEPRAVIAKDKDGKDHNFNQCELGGFEFEIILKNKPKTNKIVLNIETQGLKFYYQPELTQQEIDSGATQPDNVVGSYAVYHQTQSKLFKTKAEGDKYKCGKAFHIYRPKITDADGKWVWGELSLDEKVGTLTTTIPQEFLDTAVYPISTGTTNFGWDEKGGITVNIEDRIAGGLFTCLEAGTGISITVYIQDYNTGARPIKCALYDGNSPITNGTTEERALAGTLDDWQIFNFGTGPTLANQAYRIAAWAEEGDATCKVYSDFDYPETYSTSDVEYNGWPDPITWSDVTMYILSIYCTYEEEAEGWTNIAKVSGITATDLGKVNGIDVADIAKMNGVAV